MPIDNHTDADDHAHADEHTHTDAQDHTHRASSRGQAFLWGGIGLGFLLVVILFTDGFGLLRKSGNEGGGPVMIVRQGDKIIVPEGSPLRDKLSVKPATSETVGAKLVLPGIVESDPARTAAVLTPVGGRLLELKVVLGERVVEGQVLAVIDSPDLAQAYDDNAKAADTFKLTEVNLSRQEGQAKIGSVSDRDLDQARSDHAQAAAEYTRTQARLKVLGGSAESGKRTSLLTVRAPVGGSISNLAVAPTNMINDPTQPMMTIADLKTVWVTALVPEKDVAAVFKGQDADVRLMAYPDLPLRGKVLFVADTIEADSRRDKVRIAFSNPDYRLRPNMFATVTLQAAEHPRVVLPSSALLVNNDRTTVFVATAPWTFERRTVEPQLEEGPSVAISSGVQPGEQVVVRGGILLND
jgi:cobalt-zinc-cadmium efflux system membrane fusion protein